MDNVVIQILCIANNIAYFCNDFILRESVVFGIAFGKKRNIEPPLMIPSIV